MLNFQGRIWRGKTDEYKSHFCITPQQQNGAKQEVKGNSTEMGRLLCFSAEQPFTQNMRFVTYTTWKVFKYGVFSGPYLDTFHAVSARIEPGKRTISMV